MDDLNMMQRIAVWALPVLFAITVHEVAHGWIALRLGDKTAMMLGRLTLNPLKHIDPIGTVLLPLVMLMLGGFIFGWAKPVPVTWENLKHPKRDMALVAAAGPLANLMMVLLWALIFKVCLLLGDYLSFSITLILLMCVAGILINLLLMFFNLLPIPPLDGGRIMSSVLPSKLEWQYNRIEPYGILIILLLVTLMITQGIGSVFIMQIIVTSLTIIGNVIGVSPEILVNIFRFIL